VNPGLRWLLCAFAAAACAEDAVVEPWQVRAELQIVHLDAQRAVPLIARFTDDAKGAGEELRQLLADGNATLTAHLIVRTGNGLRGVAEQTTEVRYPTEISPSDPSLIPARKPGAAPESVHFPVTAFERRQSGSTFEIEPFVHPGGRLIAVNVKLNVVDYPGIQRFESSVRADGTKLHWEQPVFHSRGNSRHLIARADLPVLIGCCKLQNNKRVAELHVLTIYVRLLNGALALDSGKLQASPAKSAELVPTLPCSQARIEFHRFIVPTADGLKWRALLLDPSRVEAAFENLLAETKIGSSQLAEILSVPNRDKDRGVFYNWREQRYEMELSMPGHGIQWSKEQEEAFRRIRIGTPPFAFEKRDIGETLEFESVHDDQGMGVELTLNSQATSFRGFARWPAGPSNGSQMAQTYYFEPDFTSHHTSAAFHLPNRQRVLLAFHKLPALDGRCEISLIRAVTEHFTDEPKPQ